MPDITPPKDNERWGCLYLTVLAITAMVLGTLIYLRQ